MVIKKGRVHLPSIVRISTYGKDTGGISTVNLTKKSMKSQTTTKFQSSYIKK